MLSIGRTLGKIVNLQDQRYGFRAQMVLAMREYARRAMVADISKNSRTKEVDRKRSVVTRGRGRQPTDGPVSCRAGPN